MTEAEIEDSIEVVHQTAKAMPEVSTGRDVFTERLANFCKFSLPDAWVVDLIDKAEEGDRQAEAVLCTLAAARFFRSKRTPLEVWLYCRLEERAKQYGHDRADDTYYRNILIGCSVHRLCEKHPDLQATRLDRQEGKTEISACAIVSRGLGRAGIDLSESRVESIWQTWRKKPKRTQRHN
jgi:hypothetical protein